MELRPKPHGSPPQVKHGTRFGFIRYVDEDGHKDPQPIVVIIVDETSKKKIAGRRQPELVFKGEITISVDLTKALFLLALDQLTFTENWLPEILFYPDEYQDEVTVAVITANKKLEDLGMKKIEFTYATKTADEARA